MTPHDHPDEQRTHPVRATTAMNQLTGVTECNLAAHPRPDCKVVLPRHVADEASRALDATSRITPYPNGSPAWRDCLTRFLERYSMGTVAPVCELGELA
ncbi:lantibiotic dehydratase [Streptomyces sp.]|uniref:lantibiotic dehydratase n=1 Tax=Streptomyces sp. TaxID=1931 RepID=UPI0028119425|nr:lantibiotic dehydratase [Streptomyces sp.]